MHAARCLPGYRVYAVSLLVGLTLLTSCDLKDRWLIPDAQFYPAGIDYWHAGRSFLVGSYQHGGIWGISAAGISDAEPFLPSHEAGPQKALRVRVDNARERLWVLDTDAVYVYTLPDRRLIAKVSLPGALAPTRKNCLPDLALDAATGAAYVTDSASSRLHYIHEGSSEQSMVRSEIRVRFPDPSASSRLTAIAVLHDPHAIIGGVASTGEIWRIDPRTGHAARVILRNEETVRGVCAIGTTGRAYGTRPAATHQLYVTTGFHHQVFSVAFENKLDHAGVTAVGRLPGFNTPVDLVALHGHVVVTASQLARHADFGGDGAAELPFRLELMPGVIEPVSTFRTAR
jgi:hypothetical protein